MKEDGSDNHGIIPGLEIVSSGLIAGQTPGSGLAGFTKVGGGRVIRFGSGIVSSTNEGSVSGPFDTDEKEDRPSDAAFQESSAGSKTLLSVSCSDKLQD